MAVIVWFASHNSLAPLIAGAAVIGFGQLASGVYQAQAWAFIPRKRQDRRWALPVAWELGSGLAPAGVLFGSASPGSPAIVLWGAAAMLAAGAAVGIGKLVTRP